jgi:hypothetical protein
MNNDRLSHLQSEINGYYEQLADKETAFRVADLSSKAEIRQQIKILKKEMVTPQREYWLWLKSQTADLEITEANAATANKAIIDNVEILESEPTVHDNAELIKLLTEIKSELTKPEIPASGKFKTAIPLLPGLLSYEMELDTEGLLRRLFPIFSRLAVKPKKT